MVDTAGRIKTGSPTAVPKSCRRHRSCRASGEDTAAASVNLLPPLAEKCEELHALAQPAHHHLRALHHLGNDRGNLGSAEIEAAIQILNGLEDLGVAQMRIVKRGDLHAVRIDQVGVLLVEPAMLECLAIKLRSRIGRGDARPESCAD